MASYDKQKLLALMEQRRAAHLILTDLSGRLREAKSEREVVKNKIHMDTRNVRLPDGFLNRLLALQTNEALSLTVDEVQLYTEQHDKEVRYYTKINFATYRQYILARDKAARLEETYESAQKDFNERFDIVARLREVVREWGFADPELEM